MQRDPLAYFVDLPRRYGGFVPMRLGPIRYVNLSDADLIEQVLVDDAAGYKKGIALERARVVLGDGLLTSEGDVHRRQARLIAPAFSRRRIVGYAPIFRRITEETTAAWRDGDVIDIAAEMTRLTLRIVVAALFGQGLDPAAADRVGRALTHVLEDFEWLVKHPLGPLRGRIPTPRVRRFRAARAVIDTTVDQLIATRSDTAGSGDDLLSVLLAARDDDGSLISDAQLRDEAITLLIAGHETTASWLSFTWLALADRPDVEARLHAEIDQLADEPVTLERAERLPYLRAVLEETLRLYPPAWGIGRRAVDQRALGRHTVEKGAVVSICQYVMHRHPNHWPDPERFDPDRWLAGRPPGLPRGAFFPFSDGPRRCIAEHFARAEALIAVATVAGAWSLEHAGTAIGELDARVTLRPRGRLRMRARQR